MSKYLFDGLPQTVVTYIKVHLRHMYSTGLFNPQEKEDLIQDLVLFYLERYRNQETIPDALLFTAFRTKANHLIRTRLREIQSGFYAIESLDSTSENEVVELSSGISLKDLENAITLKEVRKFLSDKQNQFIDLILSGMTAEKARSELHISHKVFSSIRKRILQEQKK